MNSNSMGDEKDKAVGVVADPSRRVPKYCTNVLISKLSNGHVIFSFLQNDSTNSEGESEVNGSVLIERILVDGDHAVKILDALKKTLEA